MTTLPNYLIVPDKCQHCRYLEQAFRMLHIPYTTCSPDKLQSADFLEKAKPTHLLTCEHHLASVANLAERYVVIIAEKTEANLKTPERAHTRSIKVPFTIYELKNTLSAPEPTYCVHEEDNHPCLKNLVGESDAIKKIKHIITQVAYSDSNILILGQSGTGKEVIAACIHQLSNRAKNPFVPINCGAIPAELMESELFGHEKGAFTGASSKRAGRFEIANHGTLFLDEIGDMPLPMQVKLLRVLQDRKIERVGSTSTIDIDVRLIAATNRNLEEMIAENRFREDLYYRLNVIPIYVPSLAERLSDIPLLVQHQIEKISKRIPHPVIFSSGAIDALCQYDWPGNVRELSNFIERMAVLCDDSVIDKSAVTEQLNSFISMHRQKSQSKSRTENTPASNSNSAA